MTFKKLALVTAMAMLPMSAMAVDVLDDETMSGVTGQDGIRVTMDLNLNTNVLVHDIDGFTDTSGNVNTDAGAIVITGMGFVSGTGGITLDIDAGDSVQNGGDATTPTLNIKVNIPDGTTLTTGAISVANSNRDDGAWGFEAGTNTANIIETSTITLNNTDLNIQLGNEPQGYMILLDTIMTGGLTVTGFALNDVNGKPGAIPDPLVDPGPGAIGAGAITIKNSGDANLFITAGIDVTDEGLMVDLAAFGDAGGADVRVERLYLGSPDIFGAGTSYVGDLEVQGLTLTGAITISGH